MNAPPGGSKMLYDSWKRFYRCRKENNITVELQVIGILDREGGQVVCASKKSESPLQKSLQVRNETKLANYFQRLVTSILLHSTGTPIHLIVVTEQESLAAIRRDLKNQIGRHLSTSIIRRPTPDVVNFVHLFPKYLANSLSTR